MEYEYQTQPGKLLARLESNFQKSWGNPPWWNLFIVLPFVLGIALSVYQWRHASRVIARQQTTWGTITAHEPSNHNRYGYTFSVNGQTYSGWEIPLRVEPTIGQRVVVFYDPQRPETNSLTDFQQLSMNALGPIPFLIVMIAGFTALIAILRHRAAQKRSDREQT